MGTGSPSPNTATGRGDLPYILVVKGTHETTRVIRQTLLWHHCMGKNLYPTGDLFSSLRSSKAAPTLNNSSTLVKTRKEMTLQLPAVRIPNPLHAVQ